MATKAIFTGGGTAGHVTPNIALMRALGAEGYELHYIGTADGIEKDLIFGLPDVDYHEISAGKVRRYFSLKNVGDVFRVIRGIGQARKLVKQIEPDVVFSKGGFVSVPVVLGAKGICPIVAHESDFSPGLANRVANRHATTVCVTFEDTLAHVKKNKGVCTGTPIRRELYAGDPARGRSFAGIDDTKPVLLVTGGSQGAQAINETLRLSLDVLLGEFHVLHLCGKGKTDPSIKKAGYVQFEYVGGELPDLFALADIVLSRAGANSVFEFLALKKPALLVPLPLEASRGDQIQNAEYFKKHGYASVLEQKDLTPDTLVDAIRRLYNNRADYIRAMEQAKNADGTSAVLHEIRRAAAKNTNN